MSHDDETATQSPRDPMVAPSSFASRRSHVHASQFTNSLLPSALSSFKEAMGSEDSPNYPPPFTPLPRDENEVALEDNGEGPATSSSRLSSPDGDQSILPDSPTSAPQQSPVIPQELFRPPHPPTPTYNYQPSGTPHHSNFPYSIGPSPTLDSQQSPISAGGSMPRMSPAVSQGSMPSVPSNPQHSPYPYQRPPLSYLTNQVPVFSNVQNPNSQLSLVGVHPRMMPGFNSGHAAAMPHFLGHPPHQQLSTNDRPFKCDQCPQSFNRNHDLKRHKRIHLAVKPFPCNYCDKSFSRVDALNVCTSIVYERQANSDRIASHTCERVWKAYGLSRRCEARSQFCQFFGSH
jgi:uncharacterized Zn-finger protein